MEVNVLEGHEKNKKIKKYKRFSLLFLCGTDGQPYQSPLERTCKQLNVFGKSSESLGHANCLLFLQNWPWLNWCHGFALKSKEDERTKVGSVVNGNDNFSFDNHWIWLCNYILRNQFKKITSAKKNFKSRQLIVAILAL